jgi:hypothetical protein
MMMSISKFKFFAGKIVYLSYWISRQGIHHPYH